MRLLDFGMTDEMVEIACFHCTLWAFYTFNQLIGDIGTLNTHDAFLSAAVTQKIDPAISCAFNRLFSSVNRLFSLNKSSYFSSNSLYFKS